MELIVLIDLCFVIAVFVAAERWLKFQFHLSTAIILMFTASGLLWLNIEGTRGNFVVPLHFYRDKGGIEVTHLYGWPCSFWEHQSVEEYRRYIDFPDWFGPYYLLHSFSINLISWVTILMVVAIFSEKFIRRKEKKLPLKTHTLEAKDWQTVQMGSRTGKFSEW